MKEDAKQAWLGEIDLCTNPAQLEKIANALGVYITNRKRPLAFIGNDSTAVDFIPRIRQRMRDLMWAPTGARREWR